MRHMYRDQMFTLCVACQFWVFHFSDFPFVSPMSKKAIKSSIVCFPIGSESSVISRKRWINWFLSKRQALFPWSWLVLKENDVESSDTVQALLTKWGIWFRKWKSIMSRHTPHHWTAFRSNTIAIHHKSKDGERTKLLPRKITSLYKPASLCVISF